MRATERGIGGLRCAVVGGAGGAGSEVVVCRRSWLRMEWDLSKRLVS